MKTDKSSSLYDGVDLSTHLRRGIDFINIFDRSMMKYSGTSEKCPLVHPELGEFSFFLSYVCYVMYRYRDTFRASDYISLGKRIHKKSVSRELPIIDEDKIERARNDLMVGTALWVEQNKYIQDFLVGMPRRAILLCYSLNKSIKFLPDTHKWPAHAILDTLEFIRHNLNKNGKITPSSNELICDSKKWQVYKTNKGLRHKEGNGKDCDLYIRRASPSGE